MQEISDEIADEVTLLAIQFGLDERWLRAVDAALQEIQTAKVVPGTELLVDVVVDVRRAVQCVTGLVRCIGSVDDASPLLALMCVATNFVAAVDSRLGDLAGGDNGLGLDETRASVSVAVEIVSLASRQAFSLACRACPPPGSVRAGKRTASRACRRLGAVSMSGTRQAEKYGEAVVSYSAGDWVELVREVDGAPAGGRGKVTSTGFLGQLDIQLTTGARLMGVDASAVKSAPPGSASGDSGCAVTALAVLASAIAAVGVAWSRARWGV